MNRSVLVIRAGIGIGVIWAFCAPSGNAAAAIIGLDAAVSTTVQELIDGSPGSVSTDGDELNADASNLPLTASGDLASTDLEGVLASMGQAFSEFSDPTRLDQPNPEEFALEVACYSNRDSVAYTVLSAAEESRTVLFSRSGSATAPAEIDFGLGSTATVESRFFLSGAVIFWAADSGAGFDEAISELSVSVTRDDTGATLFQAALTVAGENAAQVSPDATGPIRYEIVTLEDLRAEGVDEGTVSILEAVARDGTLALLVIPPQEHVYTYRVTADEPLVLKAKLTARVRNVPGGTGVAATLGGPFENLADFIEHALPGVNGMSFEQSVNKASANRAMGVITADDSSDRTPAGRLCGAFGFEGLALIAAVLFITLGRTRW